MRGATALTLLALAFSLFGSTRAFGSPSADEVGINERLGATVPLDLKLVDENGQTVRLGDLIDKPTVLTLNYFRCGGICTPQLNEMVRLLNRIELEPGRDFQVLTVSFDSTDTPEVAATKRTNYLRLIKRPFPPTAWRFLTGDGTATKGLADSVGFGFKKQADSFIHPAALILLSPQGKITGYIYGIAYLPADLQMALGEAAAGVTRTTISRALSFCYSYDPEGRKYVLDATRMGGVATLLIAGIVGTVILLRGRKHAARERATQ